MTTEHGSVRRALGRSSMHVAMATLLAGVPGNPAIASADAVLKWNEIAAQTATATNPFGQARIMAIVQLAVFEAVNAVTGEYEPYLDSPIVAPAGTSADVAAIVAAHKTLTTYFPAAAAQLDAARNADLAAIPDGPAKSAGIAVGLAAADAMIALRANDNSAPPQFFLPDTTLPGYWQTTPSCSALGGAFYHWQNVTPFAIESPTDFLLGPPPSLTSNRYTKDYVEVTTIGARDSAERSVDRSEVARLYAATSSGFVLSMATRQIAAAKDLSMSESARALALIMIANNDALIASFYNKYHYNYWRPETGIHDGATDDNDKTAGDATFTPFISAPCFPSYPSNHASGTSAGLEAMRRLFGAAGHHMTVSNTVPALGPLPATVITKHYTQLKEISDDVDDARVYGGIHWRFDQVEGNTLGRAVATEVVKNYLRPVRR